MWMPTGRSFREGQSGLGRTRRGSAPISNRQAPGRSTGAVSTACREGDLGNGGKPGASGAKASTLSSGWRLAWVSERVIVARKPGNAGGVKGPHFGQADQRSKGRGD